MSESPWKPITLQNSHELRGPFYHGTKARLAPGDLLAPGHPSNYEAGRLLRHIYFSANLEPAAWGAELSVAFAGAKHRGHVYQVEPTGPFEDDPNLTNKRFPGNPTKSYRSLAPLRIVGLVEDWPGHSPEEISRMLQALQNLTRSGRNVIED